MLTTYMTIFKLNSRIFKGVNFMSIVPTQTEKLLKSSQSFSQFGFSMLITRMKMQYERHPSQATLQSCTDEINAFLTKFRSIMSKDFEKIINL